MFETAAFSGREGFRSRLAGGFPIFAGTTGFVTGQESPAFDSASLWNGCLVGARCSALSMGARWAISVSLPLPPFVLPVLTRTVALLALSTGSCPLGLPDSADLGDILVESGRVARQARWNWAPYPTFASRDWRLILPSLLAFAESVALVFFPSRRAWSSKRNGVMGARRASPVNAIAYGDEAWTQDATMQHRVKELCTINGTACGRVGHCPGQASASGTGERRILSHLSDVRRSTRQSRWRRGRRASQQGVASRDPVAPDRALPVDR